MEQEPSPQQQQPEPHELYEAEPQLNPRIWIASWSDYNNGILHGEWTDATQTPEELHEAINDMLAASPSDPHAEEWGIFDYEDFGGLKIGEQETTEAVSRLANALRVAGPAFASWCHDLDDSECTLERFQEAYMGHWGSLQAYAEEILSDLIGTELGDFRKISGGLAQYIELDFEGFARDLYLSGDIHYGEDPDGGVWIFDNRV